MNRERWQRVESLYWSTLEAPDHAAFLAQACADDLDLRRDVEALLAQAPHTTALFDRFASPAPEPVLPRPALAASTTFGRYRIIELLGAGGSADVYRAFDEALEREIALKIFPPAMLPTQVRTRFVLEAKAAAALNDPNVATIYETGEVDGRCYIAMEYVGGSTLRRRLQDPECTRADLFGYLAQVARALERAHARGIVHCDLKPENVMLTTEGLVKILDFGLARLVREALSPQAAVEGTVGYMSPEQATQHPIDHRSDIFSFGCMLFEAATGTTPFYDESAVRSLYRLMYEEPIKVTGAKLPAGLGALIDRCLVKDPAARCGSMQEVRQQLETALTPRQRGWLWPSVAATVAAIVGASAWWWIAPGPNPEAYEQLLRGRFEMWRYTPESSENAAANFTKALQKDPQYAEAAAELANTLRRGGLAGVREPMQALREAEVEARRAIALNDALPQAHTVLADVLRDQWKWQDAMTIYNQTVARFPDYIPAHVSRALELSVLGDRAEATRELLKMETLARQQDAVGHSIVIDLAAGFYNVKDFTRALSILDAAARNDDYAPALKAWTGQVYGAMGRFDKALENLTKAKERGDNTLGTWCYLVYALARTHDRPGALQLLDEIRSSPNYLAASSLAIAYVGIREYEQALTALETAYMKHDPLLPYIVVEWYLDPIRDDPRFRRIVAGMGIPVS